MGSAASSFNGIRGGAATENEFGALCEKAAGGNNFIALHALHASHFSHEKAVCLCLSIGVFAPTGSA